MRHIVESFLECTPWPARYTHLDVSREVYDISDQANNSVFLPLELIKAINKKTNLALAELQSTTQNPSAAPLAPKSAEFQHFFLKS